MEDPTLTNYEAKRWKTIYPVYLNSKKTIAEGRRLPVAKAVDNPTLNEIVEVIKFLGLQVEVEVLYLLLKYRNEGERLISFLRLNEPGR